MPAAVLAAVAAMPAEAATIRLGTYYSIATTDLVASGGTGELTENLDNTYDSTANDGSFTQTSAETAPLDSASGAASADARTGILRTVSTTSAAMATSTATPSATASAMSALGESYAITGSGRIRIEMAYDGLWNVAAQQFDNGGTVGSFALGWLASGSLALSGVTSETGDRAFQLDQSSANASGTTSGLLWAEGNVNAGDTIGVNSMFSTSINGGTNGTVDFSHTAYFNVSFLDGASGTPSDPKFLSNPGGGGLPSVPLPASVVLLAGALGGFGVVGRRRRAA